MKHLLVVIVILVLGYGAWHFVPKAERDEGVRLISRHGIRLLALIAIALIVLGIAYYTTASKIL